MKPRIGRLVRRALVASILLAPAPSISIAHQGSEHATPEAPAAAPLFEPPPAGSYELPVIDRVREHQLVDSRGESAPLLGLASRKVTLLGFVYGSCTDVQGCPLSLAVMRKVDRALARRGEQRVRLITASFDPTRDTPAKMRTLREQMAPQSDWRFLTSTSPAAIAPVLEDFGQDAMRVLAEDGADVGLIRHVLKVFLIDASGGVRNVYSAGFLDARVLLNDLDTLLDAAALGRE